MYAGDDTTAQGRGVALLDQVQRSTTITVQATRFSAAAWALGEVSLLELIRRFKQMRGHHARICAQLADGVYPVEEAERVGELVDELAREIARRVTGWRDREDKR